MIDSSVQEFRYQLLSDISDPDNGNLSEEYPVERFTEYVTAMLSESGASFDLSIGHIERQFGSRSVRCDAWGADLSEGRLDLVVSDYFGVDNPETINKSNLESSLKRALRLLEFCKKTQLSEIEPASKTYDCVSLVKEVLGSIGQVRLHYLTDSEISLREEPEVIGPSGVDIQIHKWDIVRLSRAQASEANQERIEIDLVKRFGRGLPCLSMPGNSDEYSGYLAILPGEWLADLYEEYAGRMMELNVRSFLQQKGKVNKGIRDTIINEPSRFLAYNNGISATVESLEVERNDSGQEVITSMRGLQIVNGGQTVASIHRAKKADRCSHLQRVAVQAKITKVNPESLDELVPKISRFSNTQNKVNEADFAANDSFHVEIERLSQTVWTPGQQFKWFYERARGQYQVAKSRNSTTPARRKQFETINPSSKKFVKTDLAKYENAWAQLPYIVSRGAQKNFVHYMSKVKRERKNEVPDVGFFKDLISKAIIFKNAESIARKHAFSAYRANAVAYTVALLSNKTYGRIVLRNVWNRQEVTQPINKVLFDWMPEVLDRIIESAGGRNITEWAKREECWEAVKEMEFVIPEALEAELSQGDHLPTVGEDARKGKITMTPEGRRNIALTMGLDAEMWWKITKWGQKSGELTEFQCSLATTMAGYALGQWVKVPSVKQAKHSAKIVADLQESGVLKRLEEDEVDGE
ncbi:AIPR protein [Franzmannia pantelleriensis]|uniref:AIPR protein n=1 Tax=Franzmannia pantelleriensis TaxID=48727 RepID=A0A1G9KZ21_9GAMM|nr:AIPR family protein [Halomonas pantelleriensis]SDL54585.1 AIPR protein [Halomonas pantelleriensis]